MKTTVIFTSDLVIPGYTDWLMHDITNHRLSVSGYTKKVICHTGLSILLQRYEKSEDLLVKAKKSLSSPKEQRFIQILHDEPEDLIRWMVGMPGLTSVLPTRLEQVHSGREPYNAGIPYIIPMTVPENDIFTAIGFTDLSPINTGV